MYIFISETSVGLLNTAVELWQLSIIFMVRKDVIELFSVHQKPNQLLQYVNFNLTVWVPTSLIYAPETIILWLREPGASYTSTEKAVNGVSKVGNSSLQSLLLWVLIVKGNCVLMSNSTLVTVVAPTLKLSAQAKTLLCKKVPIKRSTINFGSKNFLFAFTFSAKKERFFSLVITKSRV